ncbi:ABC transporter permease [Streptomyces sp. WMMB 322]|uniref:ABC transporter permease n=1 Tax=Streptomyces sp. WMMB 322 TaxID=1286821 RepID=UPI00082377FB|nr:ABC transporter permease [Streptomyces sp. WMMB 322]SCK48447.1 ABC-2 type transport system permease protein [Streptomyces sp. WMMB 322]
MTVTTTAKAAPPGPEADGSAPTEDGQLRVALRAVGVIAHRDLLRQVKKPGVLCSQGVQILFFVLVYAVGFDGMVGSVGSMPFSAYVFPGIIAIQVVSISIASGQSYAWDREYGVLRELLVAPVPRVCLPLGKVLAGTGMVTVQSIVMLAFSPLMGVPLAPARFVATVGCYALAAMVFSVIGLCLATLIQRVQTLQATVQMAMFPMLFLSGSVFAADDAPAWLAWIMHANPMTYAVDLARQTLLGGGGLLSWWADLCVLGTVLAAVLTLLRIRSGR